MKLKNCSTKTSKVPSIFARCSRFLVHINEKGILSYMKCVSKKERGHVTILQWVCGVQALESTGAGGEAIGKACGTRYSLNGSSR